MDAVEIRNYEALGSMNQPPYPYPPPQYPQHYPPQAAIVILVMAHK